MNIWNIVFLVLVFILSGVVLFFTGQEYNVRSTGQQTLEKFEQAIVQERQKAVAAQDGSQPLKAADGKTIDEMSLGELGNWLRQLRFERQRTWFNCGLRVNPERRKVTAPQLGEGNPDVAEGQLKTLELVEVSVIITGPTATRPSAEGNAEPIMEVVRPDDMQGTVYLFDEGKEGSSSAFLGRFTVSSQQPQRIDPIPYTYVTAITWVNGKPQVWVNLRTEGKKYRLFLF